MADPHNMQRVHIALQQWVGRGKLLADFAGKAGDDHHKRSLVQLHAAVKQAEEAITDMRA